jgi:hypothetical protein
MHFGRLARYHVPGAVSRPIHTRCSPPSIVADAIPRLGKSEAIPTESPAP